MGSCVEPWAARQAWGGPQHDPEYLVRDSPTEPDRQPVSTGLLSPRPRPEAHTEKLGCTGGQSVGSKHQPHRKGLPSWVDVASTLGTCRRAGGCPAGWTPRLHSAGTPAGTGRAGQPAGRALLGSPAAWSAAHSRSPAPAEGRGRRRRGGQATGQARGGHTHARPLPQGQPGCGGQPLEAGAPSAGAGPGPPPVGARRRELGSTWREAGLGSLTALAQRGLVPRSTRAGRGREGKSGQTSAHCRHWGRCGQELPWSPRHRGRLLG